MPTSSHLASLALVVSSFISLLSCSSTNVQESDNTGTAMHLHSLELFLSRGSLTETSFEQFALTDEELFFECGQMRRGRPAPASQKFARLEDEMRLSLEESISELFSSPVLQVPEPGEGRGFADPGKLTLRIVSSEGERNYSTSVDFVASYEPGPQAKIRRVVEAMRISARSLFGLEAMCGNENFYGLVSIGR